MISMMNQMNIHDNRRGIDEIPKHPLQRLEPMRRNKSLRQNSFEKWPQEAVIDPSELYNDGFYYMGMSDKVQCVYCGGVLSGWRRNDNVHREHARHFARCPYVNSLNVVADDEDDLDDLETDSVPQQPDPQENTDKLDRGTVPGHRDYEFGNLNESRKEVVKKENIEVKIYNKNYTLYSQRLESFQTWPSDHELKPEILAGAGLYYKGDKDKCQCYMCGGILAEWEEGDEPVSEHKKWFPKCGLSQ